MTKKQKRTTVIKRSWRLLMITLPAVVLLSIWQLKHHWQLVSALMNDGVNNETLTLNRQDDNKLPVLPAVPHFGLRDGGDDILLKGDLSTKWSQISNGAFHSCGLTEDSRVFCWGRNNENQVGNNPETSSPVLIGRGDVAESETITQLRSGYEHNCVLTDSGRAYCWGAGGYGRLGGGNYQNKSVMTAVSQGEIRYRDISLGEKHTCAVSTTNRVYCWGNNSSNQLGRYGVINSTTPVRTTSSSIVNSQQITQLTAGYNHNCVLTELGRAYCWGGGNQGQLGDGTQNTNDRFRLVRNDNLAPDELFTQVSANNEHTCALTSMNRAFCWGRGVNGRLGNGTFLMKTIPSLVDQQNLAATIYFKKIIAGYSSTCAIGSNDKLYCWGHNANNQFGDGLQTNEPRPKLTNLPPLSNSSFQEAVVGRNHICAIVGDKKEFCWGSSGYGQVGGGFVSYQSPPFEVFADRYKVVFGQVEITNGQLISEGLKITAPAISNAVSAEELVVNRSIKLNLEIRRLTDNRLVGKSIYYYAGVAHPPIRLETWLVRRSRAKVGWVSPSTDQLGRPLDVYGANYAVLEGQPNPGNGFSKITAYKMQVCQVDVDRECRDNEWQEYPLHNPIKTETVVRNLLDDKFYWFKVAAVNRYGIGDYANPIKIRSTYINLAIDQNKLDIAINPIHRVTVSTGKILSDVTTNNPTGYDLTISSNQEVTDLIGQRGQISAISGTIINPVPLVANSWGFRLPEGSFGGFNAVEINQNLANHQYKYASVSSLSQPVIVKTVNQPVDNNQTSVMFGVAVDNGMPSGIYNRQVIISAIPRP